MQEFKVQDNVIRKVRLKLILMFVPIIIGIVAFMFAIELKVTNDIDETMGMMPILLAFVLPTCIIGWLIGVKRQKKILNSYRLTFSGNLITREQLSTPTINIYTNEVQKIERGPKGGYAIYGNNKEDLILIPNWMDNDIELENMLSAICSFTEQPKQNIFYRYPTLLALLNMLAMGCFFVATNKVVIIVSGLLVAANLMWSYQKIRANKKNVDNKTNRLTSMFLPFIIFVVVVRIILTLLGIQ